MTGFNLYHVRFANKVVICHAHDELAAKRHADMWLGTNDPYTWALRHKQYHVTQLTDPDDQVIINMPIRL